MENSLNSSSSEPTESGVKSIFKKPAKNVIHAFEVSLNESITVGIQNRSDLDSATHKIVPFKKPRVLNQESFNVISEESLVNSEAEQSVSFVKPKTLFNAKKQTSDDPFNVSFNETNTSVTNQDVQSETVASVDEDDSTTFFNKSNPFKRKNKSQNEISKEKNLEISGVGDQSVETPNESEPNFTFGNTSISGVDSTTFVTKPNPFTKAKSKNDSVVREQLVQMSFTEQNITRQTPDTNNTIETSRINNATMDDLDNSSKKQNLFKKKESSADKKNQIQVSLAEDESDVEISIETNALIDEPKRSLGNLSFDKSASKLTNKSCNSGLYLDQSSINDENLNHWMSDQSDEEMPPSPACIPAIQSKPSPARETPEENENTPVETNSQPSWEEKFQEIISKSKKGGPLKNSISNIEKPSKPVKKPEKQLHQTNKYRPPKLNKPAPFATKRLYQYLIHKLEPKFGIDAVIEAEQLVSSISEVVKKVTRRKTHQKKLIQDLKKEMASAGIIETTVDFYEFVIKFLPYSFRVKTVPCVQPITNTVYPPKESVNPFDKIL